MYYRRNRNRGQSLENESRSTKCEYRVNVTPEFRHLPLSELSYNNIFNGFKEQTSAHGISHVHITRGGLKWLLWTILSVVACSILLWQTTEVFSLYLSLPVDVKLIVTHRRILPFPAVTVCNMNPYKASALQNDPRVAGLFSTNARRKRDTFDVRKQNGFDVDSNEKTFPQLSPIARGSNTPKHLEPISKERSKSLKPFANGNGNSIVHLKSMASSHHSNSTCMEPQCREEHNAAKQSLPKMRKKRVALSSSCSPSSPGYHQSSGFCFGLYNENVQLKWLNARQNCEGQGGAMAMPNSHSKWQFLKNAMPQILDGISSTDYQGFFMYYKNGQWANSLAPLSYSFTKFASSVSTSNCAMSVLNSAGNDHLWQEFACSTTGFLALCQNMIDDILWRKQNNLEAFCSRIDVDATLAIVDSEEKLQHIRSLKIFDAISSSIVNPNYMIRLERISNIDPWMWDLLKPLGSFTNWGIGQPTSGINDMCVMASVNDHKWTATSCVNANAAVGVLPLCQITGLPTLVDPLTQENSQTSTQEASSQGETPSLGTSTEQAPTVYTTSYSTDTVTKGTTVTGIERSDETTHMQSTHTANQEINMDLFSTRTQEASSTFRAPSESPTIGNELTTTTALEQHHLTQNVIEQNSEKLHEGPITVPITKNQLATPMPDSSIPSLKLVPESQFERYEVRDKFQKEEIIADVIGNMAEEEQVTLGYTLNEFLLDCQYSGRTCDTERDFSHFYNAMHGNCYTFNSGWENSSVIDSYKTGRRYGLSLVVNIGQEEYTDLLGEAAGARVVVHPQYHMAFPEDEGFVAKPGELTSGGIKMLKIDRLGDPYGNCTDVKQENYSRNVYEELYDDVIGYSMTACYKTCYQKHVIENCGCADPFFPRFGQAFNYQVVQSCDTTNITQDDCKYAIQLLYQENQLECYCPSSCNDEIYLVSTSKAKWPSDVQIDRSLQRLKDKAPTLINDREKYKHNLLKIEIYFEEFNHEHIVESPKYRDTVFLGDLGGLLGLFLAFSLMTTLELLEFVTDIVVLVYMKTCTRTIHRKTGTKANGEKLQFEKDEDIAVTKNTMYTDMLGQSLMQEYMQHGQMYCNKDNSSFVEDKSVFLLQT